MKPTANKIGNSIIYKVEFVSGQNRVIINDHYEFDRAVHFALSLHVSSNLPHEINVFHGDTVDVTFVRYDQATQI